MVDGRKRHDALLGIPGLLGLVLPNAGHLRLPAPEVQQRHVHRIRARPPRYDARRIVLTYRERAALYARIDRRVDAMAAAGLFDEAAALLREGVPAGCTAMQAIGYKEAVLALRGEISREEALAQIKQASRRYAKRQLTWFRRAPDALWIEWEGEPDFDWAMEKIRQSLLLEEKVPQCAHWGG